tara:strand:+ start:2148 stop:2336 length:189 start_codon:yes stop_codon:yes gene_type:complete
MLIPRTKQNRFQLSYKKKEVPILIPMEESLMEDLGIATRSDLHKYAIKFLHSTRKQSTFAVV